MKQTRYDEKVGITRGGIGLSGMKFNEDLIKLELQDRQMFLQNLKVFHNFDTRGNEKKIPKKKNQKSVQNKTKPLKTI